MPAKHPLPDSNSKSGASSMRSLRTRSRHTRGGVISGLLKILCLLLICLIGLGFLGWMLGKQSTTPMPAPKPVPAQVVPAGTAPAPVPAKDVAGEADAIEKEVMRRVIHGIRPELIKLAVQDDVEQRKPRVRSVARSPLMGDTGDSPAT
jgi:hypothetical protein